jgi:putative tricarboxylic transport membrane protein
VSKERIASLIFLIVGLYGLVFSMDLSLGKWNEPGPGVFPLFLSISLCLSGILWFIRGKNSSAKKAGTEWRMSARKFVTAAQIVGLTGAFIFLLDPLGYLLATILYLFVLFAWISRYSFLVSILLAVTFGIGSWLFFDKLLSTPLPKGFLPF